MLIDCLEAKLLALDLLYELEHQLVAVDILEDRFEFAVAHKNVCLIPV
jgi:hypothetical protein